MNADSFFEAFKMCKPKLIKAIESCTMANGSKMNSLSIFKLPLTITGRKYLHPVNVIADMKTTILISCMPTR
jgi:hypothetical protein